MKINHKRPDIGPFFKKKLFVKASNFHCLKWPNIEKIVSSSGHTGCNECVIQMGTQASVSEEVGAWR